MSAAAFRITLGLIKLWWILARVEQNNLSSNWPSTCQQVHPLSIPIPIILLKWHQTPYKTCLQTCVSGRDTDKLSKAIRILRRWPCIFSDMMTAGWNCVSSSWRSSERTMQPAQHECLACCLPWHCSYIVCRQPALREWHACCLLWPDFVHRQKATLMALVMSWLHCHFKKSSGARDFALKENYCSTSLMPLASWCLTAKE